MKNLLPLVLILTAGCGMHVTADKLEVEPVEVNHNINLNYRGLEEFFSTYCEAKLGTKGSPEFFHCVSDEMGRFLDAFDRFSSSQ